MAFTEGRGRAGASLGSGAAGAPGEHRQEQLLSGTSHSGGLPGVSLSQGWLNVKSCPSVPSMLTLLFPLQADLISLHALALLRQTRGRLAGIGFFGLF